MGFADLIRRGLKNLWRRKARSVLTIIAVLIGSTAVVALLILAFGVRDVFLGQMESSGMLNRITVRSSVEDEDQVEIEDEGMPLTDEMIDEFSRLNHVIAVSPVIQTHPIQSISKNEDDAKQYYSSAVGIEYHSEFQLNLLAGRNFKPGEEGYNQVILGNGVAKKIGYKENPEAAVGTEVLFHTWEGYDGIDFELPKHDAEEEEWRQSKFYKATVIGVTAPGPAEGDNYITVDWAQRIRTTHNYQWPDKEEEEQIRQQNEVIMEEAERTGRELTEEDFVQIIPEVVIEDDIAEKGYDAIYVQVDDTQNVEAVAQGIEDGYGVGAITAEEFIEQILNIFTIVSIVLSAIGGIALLVAAVGIINTMVMAVMERTREIGIMKAVGASRKDIRRLFTFEAGLLGFWGGLFGLGAGFGLTLIADIIANDQLSEQGFSAQNIAQLPWWLGIGVVAFTTIIGILAGLYPAIRAARMNPVDALRRE